MGKVENKKIMILDIIEGIISLIGFGSFLLASIIVQNDLKYVFLIVGVLIGFNLVSLIEKMTVYFEKNKEKLYNKNINISTNI